MKYFKFFEKKKKDDEIDPEEEIHVPELVLKMSSLKRILKEKGYKIEKK